MSAAMTYLSHPQTKISPLLARVFNGFNSLFYIAHAILFIARVTLQDDRRFRFREGGMDKLILICKTEIGFSALNIAITILGVFLRILPGSVAVWLLGIKSFVMWIEMKELKELNKTALRSSLSGPHEAQRLINEVHNGLQLAENIERQGSLLTGEALNRLRRRHG